MKKKEIKRVLKGKITFGISSARCAVGSYLFLNQLSDTGQYYMNLSHSFLNQKNCSCDCHEKVKAEHRQSEFVKERWYIYNDVNSEVEHFYLWKRIG